MAISIMRNVGLCLKKSPQDTVEYIKTLLHCKFNSLLYKTKSNWISYKIDQQINSDPEKYADNLFFLAYLKHINWQEPVWFDEKINYLKCHNYLHNQQVVMCADKYRVREYIKSKGLESILSKIYSHADNVYDLNIDNLPDRFAIKRNNDAGGVVVISGKNDLRKLEKKLQWLDKTTIRNYGVKKAEYHYQYIEPHYYIEEYLGTSDGKYPYDYKFFCMNGVPTACLICIGRENEKEILRFMVDMEFRLLDIMIGEKEITKEECERYKPSVWEKLKDCARTLAEGFPFVRIDLYDVDGRIVFGEMTFTPMCGINYYFSEYGQVYLGSLLEL